MSIIDRLFKWFSIADKKEEVLNIGYVLDGEPKTSEDIDKLFKAYKLDKYLEAVKPLIRPKIELELQPQEEELFGVGESKVGGQPDLSGSNDWPKNENGKEMSFIAQINCSDLSNYDESKLFPQTGLISFFYCADQEAWGFDPKDKNRFKVLFFEDIDKLNKIDFPENLEDDSRFNANKIDFDASLSLPTWDNDLIELDDNDSDNYSEATEGVENQIYGWANNIQNTMELECQLVTNGLYCGDTTGYEDPRRKELEKNKADWIPLLQIGSETEKTKMMWGDSGRIFYWIRKEDLANRSFDKAWCILQCY